MSGAGGDRSWLRLDAYFMTDAKLYGAVQSAGCGPVGFLAWVQLLALAKQQRRDGEATVLLHDLSMVGLSIDAYDGLVDAFAARGLVIVLEREPSMWKVSIVDWSRWQTATSTERVRRHRVRKESGVDYAASQHGYVYVIDSGSRIKVGFSKNPWARRKQIEAQKDVMSAVLVATFRATLADERAIHEALGRHRVAGEWYERVPDVQRIVQAFFDDGSSVGSSGSVSSRSDVTQTGDWIQEDNRLQSAGSGALERVPAPARVRGDGGDGSRDSGFVPPPPVAGFDGDDGPLGTLRAAVTDSDAENVPPDESSPDALSSRDAAIAAAQKLRTVINADTAWMADQIGLKITYGRLPPAAAIKAAEQLVDRIAGGWRPNQPERVFGYYLTTIASCAVEVSLVDTEAAASADRKRRLDEYVAEFNRQET